MKNKILFLDFETYGPVDIKSRGARNYAEKANVLCVSFAFDKGKVKTVTNYDREKFVMPAEVLAHIKSGGLICAHNWAFEYYIMTESLGIKIKPSQFICTAATALRYGQPGSLDAAAKSLKLKNQKEKTKGSLLIQRYSVPQKDGTFRAIPKDDRKLWSEYSKADVETMRELFYKFPALHTEKFESDIFRADQIMNTKGVKFDLENTDKLISLYETVTSEVGRQAEKLCGLTKDKKLVAQSPLALKKWLSVQGVTIENAQESTLDELYSKTKNKKIKQAIEYRRILAAAAPKKLYAIKEHADDSGIIRDTLAYYGAHTGRFAGRGVQIQNFYRDAHPDFFKGLGEVEKAVKDKKYTNVVENISRLLRGLIVPQKGKFIVGDFSAIEARGIFWLSGCASGLQVYKENKNIYIETAERIFQKKISKEKNMFEYSVGKAAVLQLGFGAGSESFFDYCVEKKSPITLRMAENIVKLYRGVYSDVPRFWYDTERAFKACLHTGEPQTLGTGLRTLVFATTKDRSFLRIILPSGRALYYYKPFVREEKGRWVIYSYFTKGGLTKIWGGVIAHNVTQAFCRDLLMHSLLETEKAKNLTYAFTVHDEIVCESEKADNGLKELQTIMQTPPVWATGFPLTAECKIMERYGK